MRWPTPAASSFGISRSETWENCSVCLDVFRTSTCFVRSASWAPATGPNRHAASVVIHNAERRTPRGKVSMWSLDQNSVSRVILKKRGVRIVLGLGHGAPGTKALLYVRPALEFSAL